MSLSPSMSSGFTAARNRSKYVSPLSGMCSLCTEECPGPCEIAQAAVLGKITVYPTTTGPNQIASEKDYPVDFSHFNIIMNTQRYLTSTLLPNTVAITGSSWICPSFCPHW